MRIPHVCVVLALTLCCSGGAGTTSPQRPHIAAVASQDAAVPPDVPAPVIAPKPLPTVTLTLDKVVELDGEERINAILLDYTIEQIAAGPGGEEAYPSGSGVVMGVDVGGHRLQLSDLSAGYDSQKVAWTPHHRVTLIHHESDVSSVTLKIEKITEVAEETIHRNVRVERGKALALEESLEAVFTTHGHKSVQSGQTSPLIVGMAYRRNGQGVDKGRYNLYPPEDGTWRWRDYQFTLFEYQYGSFMNLDVARLALEPVKERASE